MTVIQSRNAEHPSTTRETFCKDIYGLYKSNKMLRRRGGDPGLILGQLLNFGIALTFGLASGARRDRISRVKSAIQVLLPNHKDAVVHLLELIFGNFSKCDFATSLQEEARVKLAIDLLVRIHEQVELGVESDYILVANCLRNNMRMIRYSTTGSSPDRFVWLLKHYGISNACQPYISFRETHAVRSHELDLTKLRQTAIYFLLDEKWRRDGKIEKLLHRLRQTDLISRSG